MGCAVTVFHARTDRSVARRQIAGVLATVMTATNLVLLTTSSAAQAAPPKPACPQTQPTAAAAAAAAASCGGRVEVAAARTERSQVFANHNGSFTSTQAARTQRVRRPDGTWVAPDPTVQRVPGGFAPVASTLDTTFSAGGTATLATVRRAGTELSLHWSGPLPTPVAAGSTLTYSEVLPGVDLVVTAEIEGFGETLVVKSAKAATNAKLATVQLSTAAKGLKPTQG